MRQSVAENPGKKILAVPGIDNRAEIERGAAQRPEPDARRHGAVAARQVIDAAVSDVPHSR